MGKLKSYLINTTGLLDKTTNEQVEDIAIDAIETLRKDSNRCIVLEEKNKNNEVLIGQLNIEIKELKAIKDDRQLQINNLIDRYIELIKQIE